MKGCKLLMILTACLGSVGANAEVLMQWNRVPLPVELHVGEERIIFVDKNVKVGLLPDLDNKIEVQSMGGAVYLKALERFDLSRVQLRDMESGQIILLDVKSRNAKGKLDNIRIVDASVQNNSKTVDQTTVSDPEPATVAKPALPAPAALTRYAAQSLYAPLRTIEPLDGVRRVANKLPKTIPNLMPNLVLQAVPLESWELDGFVVTAVRLKNLENHRIQLDPRYLQGYFYSATFQHHWLGRKGTPEDTTVVYLVTEGSPANAFILKTYKTANRAKAGSKK